MEQYKEKLRIQNWVMAVGCLILALFAVLAIGSEVGWFRILRPIAGDSHWHSAWFGYVTGACCGILAMLLAGLIQNCRALKDDKKLKKRYVKEHDERTQQIRILARNTAMQILLIAGLVATVIAGYFSITVSLTILACVFLSGLTGMALVGYYSKKL